MHPEPKDRSKDRAVPPKLGEMNPVKLAAREIEERLDRLQKSHGS